MKKSYYIIIGIIFVYFIFFIFSISVDIYNLSITKDNNIYHKISDNIKTEKYVLGKESISSIRSIINEHNNRDLFFMNDTNYLGYYIKSDGNIITTFYAKQRYEEISDTMIDFSNYLENKNIDFLYLENPTKNYIEKETLDKFNLPYYENGYNKIYKKFNDSGVDYIDTNKVINDFNNKYEDKYYKGDFHWTTETSKNFSNYLCNYLNDKYKYNLDANILNDNNFNIVRYKNKFAGYYTIGAGLGKKYYDNMNYYLYNKDSNFEVNYDGEILNGDFNSVMYDQNYAIDRDDESSASLAYSYQMHSVKKIKHIENKTTSSDKKIVVIGDSMFFSMGLFVSLLFKDVKIIDIRNDYGNFDSSVRKYIEENKPDLVIYMTETFDSDDFKKVLN